MNRLQQKHKPFPIGVSACLLGEDVRYDGGNKSNHTVTKVLAKHFSLYGICPEVMAGLGVPRPPVQLVKTDDGIKALGVNERDLDVTEKLNRCGEHEASLISSLCGFVVKSRSPSCGFGSTPIHNIEREQVSSGDGLFVHWLVKHCPMLPLIEERQLGNVKRRINFTYRAEAYGVWRDMVQHKVGKDELLGFHAHYSRYFRHNGRCFNELERWLLRGGVKSLAAPALETYGQRFMTLTELPDTPWKKGTV